MPVCYEITRTETRISAKTTRSRPPIHFLERLRHIQKGYTSISMNDDETHVRIWSWSSGGAISRPKMHFSWTFSGPGNSNLPLNLQRARWACGGHGRLVLWKGEGGRLVSHKENGWPAGKGGRPATCPNLRAFWSFHLFSSCSLIQRLGAYKCSRDLLSSCLLHHFLLQIRVPYAFSNAPRKLFSQKYSVLNTLKRLNFGFGASFLIFATWG